MEEEAAARKILLARRRELEQESQLNSNITLSNLGPRPWPPGSNREYRRLEAQAQAEYDDDDYEEEEHAARRAAWRAAYSIPQKVMPLGSRPAGIGPQAYQRVVRENPPPKTRPSRRRVPWSDYENSTWICEATGEVMPHPPFFDRMVDIMLEHRPGDQQWHSIRRPQLQMGQPKRRGMVKQLQLHRRSRR